MEFHDAANLFPMDPATLDELAKDIKAHGQKETIKIYDGKILDGRRRFTACGKAGVEPKFETIETDDPITYVVSLNLHRRHLTASEKGMIAQEATDLRAVLEEQARERQIRKPADFVRATLPEQNKRSRDELGKLFGIGGRTIEYANKVAKEGDPELVKAVKEGRLSVYKAAKAVADPPEKQRELAENATRTRKKAPAKQKPPYRMTAEEKQMRKHRVTFNAQTFVNICKEQIDRIERHDPIAIPALKDLISYAQKTIKSLEGL